MGRAKCRNVQVTWDLITAKFYSQSSAERAEIDLNIVQQILMLQWWLSNASYISFICNVSLGAKIPELRRSEIFSLLPEFHESPKNFRRTAVTEIVAIWTNYSQSATCHCSLCKFSMLVNLNVSTIQDYKISVHSFRQEVWDSSVCSTFNSCNRNMTVLCYVLPNSITQKLHYLEPEHKN
jgi:hypothetical protein